MAKDPTFPFYAQDYLVDTIQWTRDMKSLHVDMLAISWINGNIEADAEGNPVNFTESDVALFQKIKHKWVVVDGKLVNGKLEEAREARKKFREMQSERGKKSAEKRLRFNHGSTTVQPRASVQPFEKENEEEKEYKDNIKYMQEFLKNDLDIENIRISTGKEPNKDDLLRFNAHLIIERKLYSDYGEYIKHFRNWLKLQKRETNYQSAEEIDDIVYKKRIEANLNKNNGK